MKRILLRYGMVLFLLGLITGFLVPALRNPRMGVSSHMEGVLNGMFLVVLGLAWEELRLPERGRRLASALLVGGAYTNWATTLLAAALGTSRLTPIAGAGFAGSAAAEAVVSALLVVLAVAMVVGVSLLIAGFRGQAETASALKPRLGE